MQNKNFLVVLALTLLAAGCGPFGGSTLTAGVVKTVNGGTDWKPANTIQKVTNTSLLVNTVSKLDFDPGNRQTVFLGSYNGGMFKSDDSAATWKNILSKIFVYDFVINPADSKTIYAAGLYADHGRVLKTTDGGGSWNQIFNEESAQNPVRSLALNPANPSQFVIGTASGSVIKSSDGGISWQLAKNFNDQVNKILWQSGNLYVLLKTKGLFISTDFAGTFTDMTSQLTKTENLAGVSYGAATVSAFNQAYVDLTTPNLIYLTSDQGMYKSVDGGKTWSVKVLPIKTGQNQTRSIAVALTTSNIVYTSIGSTVYKSLDSGDTWQTQSISSGGFINYILIDPQLPQIAYAGVYATPQQ